MGEKAGIQPANALLEEREGINTDILLRGAEGFADRQQGISRQA